MLCLGPVAGGGETEVLKLLDVLLSTEVETQKKQKVLQEEFYIPMAPKFAEEVVEMCNLSKGVMEQGMEKGVLRSVRAAMESLKVPAEQTMDILQVPDDEREAIRKALES